MSAIDAEPILSLSDVSVALRRGGREMVSGVSLTVNRNELFGIVGESGSGKTLLMRTVFGLHDAAHVTTGRITFDGAPMGGSGHHKAMRRLLGKRVGFVLQDPFSSLNPTMRIGRQITEALYLSSGADPRAAASIAKAVALLGEMGIPEPAEAFHQFPDQFSGGMRQRIVIAVALSQEPDILIADEPTTALDATTQRHVVDLIVERSRSRALTVILISHNLELVRQTAGRIAVLYGGQLLNVFPSADLGARQVHPYTEALFACLPTREKTLADLSSIAGEPTSAGHGRTGCAFAPRCPRAEPRCSTEPLPLYDGSASRFSACLLGIGAAP